MKTTTSSSAHHQRSRDVACHVAQPSESLTMESSGEPPQPQPPRRSKGRAAKKPEPPSLADVAAAASPTDRQALAFAREYDQEIQEEKIDPAFTGRMGQVMFHGPSGRMVSAPPLSHYCSAVSPAYPEPRLL